MLRSLLTLAVTMLLLAGRADATVYSWRDADGVFHFTNREDVLPATQPEAFRTFRQIESPAADPAVDERAAEAQATAGEVAEAGASRAYVEGVEAGIRIAEEELRLARELARAEAEELQPAAAPVVYYVQEPPPVVVSVVPARDNRYYYDGWGSCGFGGCTSFLVGPTFGGRRAGRGRGIHRGDHRFAGSGFSFAGTPGGFAFAGQHGSRGISGGRGGRCVGRR